MVVCGLSEHMLFGYSLEMSNLEFMITSTQIAILYDDNVSHFTLYTKNLIMSINLIKFLLDRWTKKNQYQYDENITFKCDDAKYEQDLGEIR